MRPLNQESLRQLFTDARTFHAWKDEPVGDDLLKYLYDLLKWAPTCVNGQPMRVLFIKSSIEKEKLISTLMPKNVEKTRTAPVTAIIAENLKWYESLARLMPHGDYYSHFEGRQVLIESTSFRNSSLQGAYLILAARALGLDCGPMSGFDNEKLDSIFFSETHWRSNFLCNLGYGKEDQNFPRSPRLEFSEACQIL